MVATGKDDKPGPPAMAKHPLTVIAGLSGSGKTIALRALEDSGFFCVGGLSPELIGPFTAALGEKHSKAGVAIGVEVRESAEIPPLVEAISGLRATQTVRLLFLEAEPEVLLRRYKETRRPHPLVGSGRPDIERAIADELEMLGPLRELADMVLDTSSYTPHQLRRHMSGTYGLSGTYSEMGLTLMSFGFKYGIPLNLDLMFDARFLSNPYFVPGLRELSGLGPEVSKYVLALPAAAEFIGRLVDFLGYLYPLYAEEGKTYLTVGIGCTGGRHRSPVIVQRVAELLRTDGPRRVHTMHRDI